MTHLWVPPSVTDEQARTAAQDSQEILGAVSTLKGTLDYWNRELRQIDERLQMVWFDEGVNILGVVPCRYHILRRNDPPSPWSIDPIETPDGEFMEPDSRVFDRLLSGDLWNDAVRRDRKRAVRMAQAAKDRERARETEDRQAEIVERIQAARRSFVSMNRDQPWSQNSAGRRGRAGYKRAA